MVKNPPAHSGNAGDIGLIPGSGRCPGVGNGNPLQHSCLEKCTEGPTEGFRAGGPQESDTAEC